MLRHPACWALLSWVPGATARHHPGNSVGKLPGVVLSNSSAPTWLRCGALKQQSESSELSRTVTRTQMTRIG